MNKFDDESQRPYPAKKDKKSWCKGKNGIEHKPIVKSYNEVKHNNNLDSHNRHKNWLLLICEGCGKELDFYFGTKRKQEWVIKFREENNIQS